MRRIKQGEKSAFNSKHILDIPLRCVINHPVLLDMPHMINEAYNLTKAESIFEVVFCSLAL
jgi:hypothetical protein